MQEDHTETISQYISDYLNYLEMERGLSKNTIIAYESDLVALFDFFAEQGIENLEEIKRRDFSQYTKFIARKEINPSSITRKIASIKGFFKYLCNKRIIKANPSVSINSPKLPKKLPKVLNIGEIDKILSSNLNEKDYAIVELLYSAGVRVSELTELELKNIDFNQKIIKVFGKVQKKELFQ